MRIVGIFILTVFIAGCNGEKVAKREEWMGKKSVEWPQMVLTNQADFNGHSSLYGASSFLIKHKGKVFGATAGHLLGVNGGVQPEVQIGNLDQVLKQWLSYPRTKTNELVEFTTVAAKGLDEEGLDWLILNTKSTGKLPATPLEMRKEPVKIGETVYLIGVPYSDRKSSQNVYKGKVTQRAFGDRFKYTIEPAVDLRGFSGAPIIDTKGKVVGVMTVWFSPKKSGEKYLESGGEDIASIYELM